jgi:hypothetical protein
MVQISPELRALFRRLGNAKTAAQPAAPPGLDALTKAAGSRDSVRCRSGHFLTGTIQSRSVLLKRRMSSPNFPAATPAPPEAILYCSPRSPRHWRAR